MQVQTARREAEQAFTVSALLEQGATVRRCWLSTPYAERLCDRFCHYLARIALPVNHGDGSEAYCQWEPPVGSRFRARQLPQWYNPSLYDDFFAQTYFI